MHEGLQDPMIAHVPPLHFKKNHLTSQKFILVSVSTRHTTALYIVTPNLVSRHIVILSFTSAN